jgi:hypothetical protein
VPASASRGKRRLLAWRERVRAVAVGERDQALGRLPQLEGGAGVLDELLAAAVDLRRPDRDELAQARIEPDRAVQLAERAHQLVGDGRHTVSLLARGTRGATALKPFEVRLTALHEPRKCSTASTRR